MNINQPSIWASVEFDCVSRDFNYKQYVQTHFDLNCKGAVVSQAAYSRLGRVFFEEMTRDYDN